MVIDVDWTGSTIRISARIILGTYLARPSVSSFVAGHYLSGFQMKAHSLKHRAKHRKHDSGSTWFSQSGHTRPSKLRTSKKHNLDPAHSLENQTRLPRMQKATLEGEGISLHALSLDILISRAFSFQSYHFGSGLK